MGDSPSHLPDDYRRGHESGSNWDSRTRDGVGHRPRVGLGSPEPCAGRYSRTARAGRLLPPDGRLLRTAMGLAANRPLGLMAPADRCLIAHGEPPVGPIVVVGIGGFAGAVVRYVLDARISAATSGAFPWGTLVINLSGSFVIGLLFALITERAAFPAEWRAPLMIGFVGSYTTFSTLTLESWRMIEDGAWLAAGGNLLGSMALGMVAVIGGVALGRAI